MRLRTLALVASTQFGLLTLTDANAQTKPSEGFTLRHEVIVDAPIEKVWEAFTTKEGLQSWMAPKVEIDLRLGGKMRSVMDANVSVGDDTTIESTILSLEPLRMISLRPTKAPGNFPFPNAMKKAWSVVYFDRLGERATKLTMIGLGYTDEPESMQMRELFDKGNAMMLERLRERFPKSAGSGGTEEAMATLAKLVGGEWIHESTKPNGTIFRARRIFEKGPDGGGLVGRGWFGDADGMWPHVDTQIWIEPGAGELRIQNIAEDGVVSRGTLTPSGKDHVRAKWTAHAPSGKRTNFVADFTFDDADHYTFVLNELVDDVTPTERLRIKYERVKQTPDAYKKIRPQLP